RTSRLQSRNSRGAGRLKDPVASADEKGRNLSAGETALATPTTRNSLGDQFQGILTAAQDGGEWAVAILYRWLHPAVVSYLRARAGDEAEDLASETWIAVARGLPNFSGHRPASRSKKWPPSPAAGRGRCGFSSTGRCAGWPSGSNVR